MLSEQKQSKQLNEDNLFNNPMVQAASAALSDEDKERYKRRGEEMYNSVDFANNKLINFPEEMLESLAHVEEQLRSGLHPVDMEKSEKDILQEAYGKEWYKKWGFINEDLTRIVTVKF